MRAVAPVDLGLHEPEIGLVHERRGLERVPTGFPPQLRAGQAAELRVDEGDQAVVGALVAGAPFPERPDDRLGIHGVRGFCHRMRMPLES